MLSVGRGPRNASCALGGGDISWPFFPLIPFCPFANVRTALWNWASRRATHLVQVTRSLTRRHRARWGIWGGSQVFALSARSLSLARGGRKRAPSPCSTISTYLPLPPPPAAAARRPPPRPSSPPFSPCPSPVPLAPFLKSLPPMLCRRLPKMYREAGESE